MMDYTNEWAKMNEAKETFFSNTAARHKELANAVCGLQNVLEPLPGIDDTSNTIKDVSSKIDKELDEIDLLLSELMA